MPGPVGDLIRLMDADSASVMQPDGKEVVIARAPARLDLIGGITDTSGGMVCALPLDAAAAVAVQRRDDRKLVIKTYNTEATGASRDARVELSLDDFYGTASLLPNATLRDLFTAGGGGRRWAAYIAGAFPMLAKHKKITRRTHGANIACFSNVPFGVGLGSSAAVACAAISALMGAFHLILEPLEIAVLAQKLEHQIVGSPRGIMDPATAMLGKKGHALVLQCQPHEVQQFLPIPAGLVFAGINSTVAPPIGSAAYQQARVSAAMAQAIIARMYHDFDIKKDPTRGYLSAVNPDMFTRYFHNVLPESITGKQFTDRFGPVLERITTVDPGAVFHPRAVALHHVEETLRATRFVTALRTGPSAAIDLGNVMLESHRSYSSNIGLGHEATDLLVDLVTARGADAGLFGARVMGVGGGGSIAVLAEDSPLGHDSLAAVCEDYRNRTGRPATLMTGSSPGAAESAITRGTPGALKAA